MTPENGYQPFSKSVRLDKRKSDGVFGIGQNVIDVRYDDFPPPLPARASFTLTIPDGSIRSEYVLFIFANGATLMRSSGEVVQWFSWIEG